MAAALVVLCTERTTAVDQIALKLTLFIGTRMRALVLFSAVAAIACTILLDASASIVVVGSLLGAFVRAIQEDIVQGCHQRALFEKATVRLPLYRRRQLEELLWPRQSGADDDEATEVKGAVSLCESPLLMSMDGSEGSSLGESTEQALWDFLMYSLEFSPAGVYVRKHVPPPQPAYPQRSSLLDPTRGPRMPKLTSFLEDGVVVFPGSASPATKSGYGNADESGAT
ncbi:uncharacterized protein LOC144166950 [Haemaphysalis longicornis]